MNTTAVDTLSFSQCEYHLLPAQKPPHVALLRPSAYSTETASLMMMMVTMVMSLRLLLLLMLLSVSLLLIVLWLLLLLLQLLCLPRLLFLLFLSFMLGDNYGKDLSSQHTRTHTHTHKTCTKDGPETDRRTRPGDNIRLCNEISRFPSPDWLGKWRNLGIGSECAHRLPENPLQF